MDPNKYIQYTVSDFVEDADFRNWVLGHGGSEDWLSFLESHPNKVAEVEEARYILLQLNAEFAEQKNEIKDLSTSWIKFQSTISDNKDKFSQSHERNPNSITRFLAIAASVLVLVAVGVWVFLWPSSEKEWMVYTTGAGEIKEVVLPDSSTIVLNAQSTLSVEKPFQTEGLRMVKFSGEGYFSIRSAKNAGNTFLIASELSEIEVLGTRFNTKSSDSLLTVSLEEGKVRLQFLDARQQLAQMDMAPGHQLSMDVEKNISVQNITDIAQYSQWKTGYFSYVGANVKQIISDISHQFDIRFQPLPAALADRKVDGVVSATNLAEALEVIKILLDVHVEQLPDSTLELKNLNF